MALVEFNKQPSRRELLWFGGLLVPFSALVGALLRFKWGCPTAGLVAWVVGGILVAVFFAVPAFRRPLYLGWMYAAMPIGMAVSFLLLAVIYYFVFTPMGLLMRLVGHDPMCRRFDRARRSYWVARPKPDGVARYFRQS